MDDGAAALPPAYWRLWTASTISNLGDGVFLVALPLLAARLTRSELSIAFIGVAAALPWLILSLPIGAIVDRADHRRLMIRADVFRAAVVAALTIAVSTHSARIWMLWVAAGCLGVAEVFFDNASQSLVPSIVPTNLLEKANGRRFAAEIAANSFIGTSMGSVLFVAALWLPFGVNAFSFAIAAALVLSITMTGEPARRRSRDTTLRTEIAEGLRWLFRQRLLRGLAIAAGVSLFGMQMTAAIFVLFAKERLHISDRWYGALLAIGAFGAVLGGLVAERFARRFGSLTIIYGTVVIWIGSMLAEGLWPRIWVSATATAVMAFGTTAWNTVTVSLRQRLVPRELFGRVNSVYRWLVWGSISIGSAVGGVVARFWGLRAPFFVGAAMAGIALLTMIPAVTGRSIAAAATTGQRPGDDLIADDTPISIDLDPWSW